jgi:RHS repeat-associated protein
LNLTVDHVFNNQAAGAAGAFGAGWTSSYGPDVKLVIFSDHVDFHDPTGYVATYTKSGSTFITPPGMDADLTLSGTTYTVTFHVSNEKWTFNSSGQWTAQTDRNGNHLNFAYSSGNPTTITDTQGRVTSFTTSSGRITSITDPTGLSFGGFTYNGSGQLIRYSDRAGTPINLGYDGNGNLTSLTSPNGAIYTITYDASRRITSLVQPLPGGRTATWGYSYGTGTTTGTDPNGHTAVFHFDASGRETSAVDQLGHTRSLTWTSNNALNTTTNALSQSTTFGYDGINNLTSAQLPTGATTNVAYGNVSHPYLPSSITDPQNSQLVFTYDTNGNLTKAHNPALNIDVLRRTYNANGTIATQTDAAGNVTTLSYDAVGNLLTLAPPAPRGAIGYTYDTLSRVVSVTDGNGVTISYSYDRLDRITQITNTSGGQTDVRQTTCYDRNGNVTFTQVPNARVDYTYSPRNEVLENATSTDLFTEAVDYRYDAAGNLAWVDDPYGTTYYAYDVANRLTSVTTPDNQVITFAYDNANRRTATNYPGGSATRVTYDAAGRVQYLDAIGAGNTLLNRSTYSYVFNGADSTLLRSVVGWASPNPNASSASFTYDGLNRLLTGGIYSYGYDSRDNLTSSSLLGSFTINNADQATALGSTPIRWDAAGNLASVDETYNTYSPTNQLLGTTGPDFQITRARYLTADQTQPYMQYYDFAGGETQVETYTNSALGVTGVVRNGDRLVFVRDPQGRPLQMVDTGAGATYYYFLDAQNSVRAIFDDAGNSVAGNTFENYGYTTTIDTAADTNPFRWLGQFVEGSGQQRFGYRRYDASLARFTQADPSEINPKLQPTPGVPALNTYQYAASDPINRTDPTGLQNLACATTFTALTTSSQAAFIELVNGDAALLAVASPEIVALIGVVAPELAGAALVTFAGATLVSFFAC